MQNTLKTSHEQSNELDYDVISKLILTAGPSITNLEVEYGVDAVKNGWNDKWGDYLSKFEKKFADYVGTKFSLATSSCTGAMHLALLAAGIGEGDEVIVPEITWIATASAVVYTGAKPVFCDVDKDSWTMLPESVEKLITNKTKAIMPVHIYGHPCDMEPLWVLAKKHNLKVIEDAAQSIGAEYKGKKTGSLGDAAGFSFQGAKAIVTGEGGMLVTSDEQLIDRARVIGDHGRSKTKALFNEEIGYKYKMSNVQAAIGTAQIERVEEIVARKIQIFKWYKERLGDVSEIALNAEKPWAKNIFWMSSIVLSDKVKHSREEFIAELKKRAVDSRPIFYPLSSFPMFEKANNPNAYHIGNRGINLPSGHHRTEEEVDYICTHIKEILGKKAGKPVISGWLKYREEVTNTLNSLKKSEGFKLKFKYADNQTGYLTPLTYANLKNDNDIKLLGEWREKVQQFFPSQFKVTFEGTKRWAEKAVLETSDRFLFFITNDKGENIGHVGLFRFNYQEKYCELDNVVRGVDAKNKGIIQGACEEIIRWVKAEFGLKKMYLRTLSDNTPALTLYNKMGFREILRVPVRKIVKGDSSHYSEIIASEYEEAEKYNVTMKMDF